MSAFGPSDGDNPELSQKASSTPAGGDEDLRERYGSVACFYFTYAVRVLSGVLGLCMAYVGSGESPRARRETRTRNCVGCAALRESLGS
jgi:hypothetical protein